MIFVFLFWEKSPKLFFFRGLVFDFFLSSFVEKKLNASVEQQKWKGHEKREWLLF